MPVYVDRAIYKFRGQMYCHMVADSLQELHRMANEIGLQRSWFQPKSWPHYDLSPSKRALAVKNGAKEISGLELGAMLKIWRENV